jgi:hypothetical protein
MPEPLVRARFVQDWLANVARVDDPWRARFFAQLEEHEAGARRAIEEASRVGWIPARYHVLLADVLAEAFGPQRAHDYYRRAFVDSLSGPVLGPLVKTAVRLFGMDLASAVKWYARGWQVSFKDAGEVSGEALGPGLAAITYRELPEVFTRSEPWLVSSVGSAYGVLDWMSLTGVVRQDLSRRREGIMRMELEWTTKRPA